MRSIDGRRLAGIAAPATPIVGRAIEYARQKCEPYLFNHVVRSWPSRAALARHSTVRRIRLQGAGRSGYQLLPDGLRRGVSPVARTELGLGFLEVAAHGLLADVELTRDLAASHSQ